MTAKLKKQMIMIGVLSLVFVGVLANSILTVKKKKKEREALNKPATPQTSSKDDENNVSTKSVSSGADIPLSTRPTKAVLKKEALEEQKRIAGGEWGKDPFYHTKAIDDGSNNSKKEHDRPSYVMPDIKEVISNSFELTGISKIGDIYSAVVNRKIVRVGDTIASDSHSFPVVDIQKDRIILNVNGGEYEIKLKK